MKEMSSIYFVILLVGFTVVDVHADVDEELAAVIDALTAAEARTALNETLVDKEARTSGNKDLCSISTNVALNKPAEISSKFDGYTSGSLAVDGNLAQQYYGGSGVLCFHTQNTPNNWWYVDLQQVYNIEKVQLYNRVDCCAERARKFKVLVGYSLDKMTEIASVESMGSTKTIIVPKYTRGRYVKLVQTVNEWFHLCEVQVWAKPAYCGSNPCKNGGTLRKDSSDKRGYTCTCATYRNYRFMGANCEEIWVKLPDKLTYDLVPRPYL